MFDELPLQAHMKAQKIASEPVSCDPQGMIIGRTRSSAYCPQGARIEIYAEKPEHNFNVNERLLSRLRLNPRLEPSFCLQNLAAKSAMRSNQRARNPLSGP